MQWYDLLCRGKFSFYEAVYPYVADYENWQEAALPSKVLWEVLCGVVLVLYTGVDMRAPHLNFIGATDASSEFGLGGCIARLDHAQLRSIGRLAERDGEYVTLSDFLQSALMLCGSDLGYSMRWRSG